MSAAEIHGMLGTYLAMDAILIPLALLSWWLLRRFAHTRLTPMPASLGQPLGLKLVAGVAWGAIAAAAVILLIWAGSGFTGAATGPANRYPLDATLESGVMIWALFAVQSFFEELAFRAVGVGYLALLLFWLIGALFAPRIEPARQRFIRRLWLFSGLTANLVVALSFAIAHDNNPHFTVYAGVNIALAGLVLGQLFWLQGAPWGAWGWHWIWNAGLASLGLPVSGVLFTPSLLGPGLGDVRTGIWSGGRFGPEGSLACIVVLLLYFSWLMWLSFRGIQDHPAPRDSDSWPTRPAPIT